jgi:hypothetical protein
LNKSFGTISQCLPSPIIQLKLVNNKGGIQKFSA